MKKSLKYLQNAGLCFFLGHLIALSACNNKPKESSQANEIKVYSPIEGNWELISKQEEGKKAVLKSPQQFKVFNNGFFSYILYDTLGNFQNAGVGTYEVNGNSYKETFKLFQIKNIMVRLIGKNGK
jgi:hypothetical protein